MKEQRQSGSLPLFISTIISSAYISIQWHTHTIADRRRNTEKKGHYQHEVKSLVLFFTSGVQEEPRKLLLDLTIQLQLSETFEHRFTFAGKK